MERIFPRLRGRVLPESAILDATPLDGDIDACAARLADVWRAFEADHSLPGGCGRVEMDGTLNLIKVTGVGGSGLISAANHTSIACQASKHLPQ